MGDEVCNGGVFEDEGSDNSDGLAHLLSTLNITESEFQDIVNNARASRSVACDYLVQSKQPKKSKPSASANHSARIRSFSVSSGTRPKRGRPRRRSPPVVPPPKILPKPLPAISSVFNDEAMEESLRFDSQTLFSTDLQGDTYFHALARSRNVGWFAPFYNRAKLERPSCDFLNCYNQDGDSPLTIFIRRGYKDGVQFCLDNSAKVLVSVNQFDFVFHPLLLSAMVNLPSASTDDDIFFLLLKKSGDEFAPSLHKSSRDMVSHYLNTALHLKKKSTQRSSSQPSDLQCNFDTDLFINYRLLEILVSLDGKCTQTTPPSRYDARERLKAVLEAGADPRSNFVTSGCNIFRWVASSATRPDVCLPLLINSWSQYLCPCPPRISDRYKAMYKFIKEYRLMDAVSGRFDLGSEKVRELMLYFCDCYYMQFDDLSEFLDLIISPPQEFFAHHHQLNC